MNSYDFMKFPGTTIHHLSSLISICLKRVTIPVRQIKKMPGIQCLLQILTIKLQLHNDTHLYFDLSGYNLIIKSKHKKDFVRHWADFIQQGTNKISLQVAIQANCS